MKPGIDIQELAATLMRQKEQKRDFLVVPSDIRAYAHDKNVELAFAMKAKPQNDDDYFAGTFTTTGHAQIGAWAGIPKQYYDIMLAHPKLLAQNLQHWLNLSSDRRLIRVMDGKIRGVLSDTYRPLDNFDLAEMLLPELLKAGAIVDGKNCQVTERKLYIKAFIRELKGEVKKGDEVCAGVILQNSEIGYGALSIKPIVNQKICDNGLIIDRLAHRKYHVGKKLDGFGEITFAEDTKTADDKAFWLKARDLVRHALSEATFFEVLSEMQVAAGTKVKEPTVAIEVVAKAHGLTIPEKESMLKHLLEGGDMTNWGFSSAVTRMAQDVESYDRSVELEQIGYRVMTSNLNKSLN